MALPNVGPVSGANVPRTVEPQQSFGNALRQAPSGGAQTGQLTGEVAPKPVEKSPSQCSAGAAQAGQTHAVSGPKANAKAQSQAAARMVDQLSGAQARLDRILELAQSGRTFTPAELLGMQAQVSQASQQLDLAGKVVDKATSGVKQILQTQV